MRGMTTTKSRIRTRVFTEIAKMAYKGFDAREFENLPFKIIPGEMAQYRDSVFVEREIVAERLRMAMGNFSRCCAVNRRLRRVSSSAGAEIIMPGIGRR